jgi:hypothetical protein
MQIDRKKVFIQMPIYSIRGTEHRKKAWGGDEEAELIPQLATMFTDQWRENRAGT